MSADDHRDRLKRALIALQRMQLRIDALERSQTAPIAVVGLGCRFPGGASGPAAYWRMLVDGVDATGEVPADRWDVDRYHDPQPGAPGKSVTRRGGFLDRVDGFDAPFFGITTREARSMDPQQRLFLEVAWEALEDAAIAPDSLRGSKTGVFAGTTTSDYLQLQLQSLAVEEIDAYLMSGNTPNVVTGRLGYLLGVHGPTVTLDTACSSSLVAVHLACRSLRSGECDLALCGGVNLILTPETFVSFSRWGMLAPDGRCKTFDAAADGFARGEGCGVIALERLDDAVRNGHRVHAVIRASAVNQDGASSGLSTPNGKAQAALLREVLDQAGLSPQQIGYVEAHGTGTSLGDPIELEAIAEAYATAQHGGEPLRVGSVKTNLGHLEAASGIAGLIKTVLAVRHGQLPAHLHYHEPNPHVDWDRLRLQIPVALEDWPSRGEPRRAGVSSFGFSGTNVHLLVEQAPPVVTESASAAPCVLPLSARTPQALRRLGGDYLAALDSADDADLADVCFTAGVGRNHFETRWAAVAADLESLRRDLRRLRDEGDAIASSPRPPRVAFLFTGQGAQYPGMARGLYDGVESFRESLDACAAAMDIPLLDVLFRRDDAELLAQTRYTQPALFAVEYATSRMWQSWGIEPAALLGHSVGEIAAACVAGVFRLEDGCRLIVERAALMQALPDGGAMCAIRAEENTLREFLATEPGVSIAAINAPRSIVISGAADAVGRVADRARAAGIDAQSLRVSHAFHSELIEPVLDPLRSIAAAIDHQSPRVPLISNLSGRPAGDELLDAGYWVEHARSPVRFAAGLAALIDDGIDVLLEVGPHPTLLALGRQCHDDANTAWIHSMRRGRNDLLETSAALCELYRRNAPVRWNQVRPAGRRVALPTYPFERERFWPATPRISGRPTAPGPKLHPLIDSRNSVPPGDRIGFESVLGEELQGWIADHRIGGKLLFPATGWIEILRCASAQCGLACDGIRNLRLHAPLEVPAQRRVFTLVEPDPDGQPARARIYSRIGSDESDWLLHAEAEIGPPEVLEVDRADPPDLSADVATGSLQRIRTELGLEFGPAFAAVVAGNSDDGEAWVRVEMSEATAATEGDYRIHPGRLDACHQALLLALGETLPKGRVPLPTAIDHYSFDPRAGRPALARARLTEGHDRGGRADIDLFDRHGCPCGRARGFRFAWIDPAIVNAESASTVVDGQASEALYEVVWRKDLSLSTSHEPDPPVRHLVLASSLEFARTVADGLTSEGAPADWLDLSAEIALGDTPTTLVLIAASSPGERLPDSEPARRELEQALKIVQLAAQSGCVRRVWIVTRRAVSTGTDDPLDCPADAGLWGFARVVAREQPQLRTTNVDLRDYDPVHVASLVRELIADGDEDRIAWRNEIRRVARLERRAAAEAQLPMRLAQARPGTLESLGWVPARADDPAAGEVRIEVESVGLNFRDVLVALDHYAGGRVPLGADCAGRIESIGPGVDDLAVGDRVVAIARGAFAHLASASRERVARLPEAVGCDEAATLPSAFLTASYGLEELAGMRSTHRVLIHSAAGGVGLAAVQLALGAGATVLATAGSATKREVLERLGVRHVFDSRSEQFVSGVRDAVGAVDIVLDSAGGTVQQRSLELLADRGCMIEIGKRDLLGAHEVSSRRPDVCYHEVDIERNMDNEPGWAARRLEALLSRIDRGELQPLPRQEFEFERVGEAFGHMARAQHVGKVVISRTIARTAGPIVRRDGSYVVTGGLGALGREVAERLVACGAGRVILVGRSAVGDEDAHWLRRLAAAGCVIETCAVDIADGHAVDRMFRELYQSELPLRGVVHAAGILHDALLGEQDAKSFRAVLAGKAVGAWNLHRATRQADLDWFVLFSSWSSLSGAEGQAGYAAANAILDGLAHYRVARGQVATSIDWGPWEGAGMAARLNSEGANPQALIGFRALSADKAWALFERSLHSGRAQLAAADVDWAIRASHDAGHGAAFFESCRSPDPAIRTVAAVSNAPNAAAELAELSGTGRVETLASWVRRCAAAVMGEQTVRGLRPDQPLREVGLDSLMAVELRNALAARLGLVLPATLAFDHPTLDRLTSHLFERLGLDESERSDGDLSSAVHEGIAELSDDEAEALLVHELETLHGGKCER